MRVDNKTLTNSRIELDGNEYHGCTIRSCTLVYKGGGLPELVNSSVLDSHFVFEGAALNTLMLLRNFYTVGAGSVVERVFDNIRGSGNPIK